MTHLILRDQRGNHNILYHVSDTAFTHLLMSLFMLSLYLNNLSLFFVETTLTHISRLNLHITSLWYLPQPPPSKINYISFGFPLCLSLNYELWFLYECQTVSKKEIIISISVPLRSSIILKLKSCTKNMEAKTLLSDGNKKVYSLFVCFF